MVEKKYICLKKKENLKIVFNMLILKVQFHVSCHWRVARWSSLQSCRYILPVILIMCWAVLWLKSPGFIYGNNKTCTLLMSQSSANAPRYSTFYTNSKFLKQLLGILQMSLSVSLRLYNLTCFKSKNCRG